MTKESSIGYWPVFEPGYSEDTLPCSHVGSSILLKPIVQSEHIRIAQSYLPLIAPMPNSPDIQIIRGNSDLSESIDRPFVRFAATRHQVTNLPGMPSTCARCSRQIECTASDACAQRGDRSDCSPVIDHPSSTADNRLVIMSPHIDPPLVRTKEAVQCRPAICLSLPA